MMKRIDGCYGNQHPHPQELLLPQQNRSNRIMIISHPQSLPPKKLLLLPPQQNSKMMIQMKLHPHPLLEERLPHPHPVAVKSLIYVASKRFCLWFIICGRACLCFHKKQKYREFLKIQFLVKILELISRYSKINVYAQKEEKRL